MSVVRKKAMEKWNYQKTQASEVNKRVKAIICETIPRVHLNVKNDALESNVVAGAVLMCPSSSFPIIAEALRICATV